MHTRRARAHDTPLLAFLLSSLSCFFHHSHIASRPSLPLSQWVFPPGVYLEQKKEWIEMIAGAGIEGDQARIVDCAPYIPAVRRTPTQPAAKEKAR